ncbi:MAG: endonuclease III domain-containing protein [Pseudomonadota bacterium]|nr:endonuclease III domain-containing protein [Pseudomonadota bacterium]
MRSEDKYQLIYEILNTHYGPQHWWPAESAFEVMVGAVLVQNTAWKNASSAIVNLQKAGLMSSSAIHQTPVDELASVIVSSGYFNIKAKRLKALCQWLEEQGGIEQLRQQQLTPLRKDLLGVHGVGPETADDIILYAFNKPVFVIDGYTRRLFSRLGLIQADLAYEVLRRDFELALAGDVELFSQYHALIVVHAKNICRKQPVCEKCCLRKSCLAARQADLF